MRINISLVTVVYRRVQSFVLFWKLRKRNSPLGSVVSQTQLSLRCNYVLKNNYMFRPMMVIVRLPWEYLRAYCKLLSTPKATWRWPSWAETCNCFSIHNYTSVTVVFNYPHFPKFSHTQRGWHNFYEFSFLDIMSHKATQLNWRCWRKCPGEDS